MVAITATQWRLPLWLWSLIPRTLSLFLSLPPVRRCARHSRVQMLRTTASDERAARQLLARDYVLSFTARLPVREVRA